LKITKLRIVNPFLLWSLIFIILNLQIALAEAPKRIVLLPFKINAEKDLSFLQDGIYDMLSSRLAKEGQVEVLPRAKAEEAIKTIAEGGTVNETTARSIGNQLNADFTLFGSLTVLGENVSIDAKMVDISGNRPTMTFFDQSQDLGAVITKINLIAADINQKMLGQAPVAETQAAAPEKEPPKTGVHAHPEKILEQEGYIGQSGTGEEESPFMARGDRQGEEKFWKSANFKHLINGIAVGDVTGDGKIETVTITPDAVIVYRSEDGRFQQLQEIPEGSKHLIGVDIADINANGFAEIFVTAFNATKKVLLSFVLEYDGKNFAKIIQDSPWIYRIVDTPARGKILLGQRPKVNQPFSGSVHEMNWENGDYVPGDEIKTPRQKNLLGFAIGDVLNDGLETVVAFKPNDKLQIIDPEGKTIWEGNDTLGGSMQYYDLPIEVPGQVQNKIYLPMRLVVRKDPASKESEVIVVTNDELTNRRIEYRQFTDARIEAFKWNGIGLASHWQTRKISGYISDFVIGDFDNDGRDELIAAVILKEGRLILISEPKSTIIAYELSVPEKPES
jgi:TolB-like protein